MRIATLKTLKLGDKVRVKQSYKDFWLREAYALCFTHPERASEEDAAYFFIRKAIGMGLPYEATFLKYYEDVGEGPGAKIKFKVGDYEDTCLIDHKDLVTKR